MEESVQPETPPDDAVGLWLDFFADRFGEAPGVDEIAWLTRTIHEFATWAGCSPHSKPAREAATRLLSVLLEVGPSNVTFAASARHLARFKPRNGPSRRDRRTLFAGWPRHKQTAGALSRGRISAADGAVTGNEP